MLISPNYTQIPNDIFDKYMSQLTGAEFKVLLAICRKTFGWQKNRDKISISQLIELTGLSNRKIIDAARKLQKNNLIKIIGKERALKEFEIIVFEKTIQNNEKNYKKNIAELTKSGEESSLDKNNLVKKVHQTGEESSPDLTKSGEESSHTKKKNINKLTKESATAPDDTFYENDFFKITTEKHKKNIDAYCGIDVYSEYKKIELWLINNPERKIKNYNKFIFNWLGRCKPRPPQKREYIDMSKDEQTYLKHKTYYTREDFIEWKRQMNYTAGGIMKTKNGYEDFIEWEKINGSR